MVRLVPGEPFGALTMFNRIKGTGLSDVLERRIHLETETGCWVWRGARQKSGYGNVKMNKRHHGVHRLVFEILRGPVPNGLVLHHRCTNKPCCNPDHLEPVTQSENRRRHWAGEPTEEDRMKPWQPIETAPTDEGADLIGFVDGSVQQIERQDGQWWLANRVNDDWRAVEPTHWMPMPEPPEEEDWRSEAIHLGI